MAMSTWECVAGAFRSRDGGTPGVTVADVLRLPDRPALRCPASVLVAGELAARGVPVALGPVSARHIRRQTFVSQIPVVVSAELGDGIGLGIAAPRAWLPEVRDLLGRWRDVAAERTVLLAAPRSFCAGVQRAKAVEQALEQPGGPVYVRKQIVHNSHVVSGLEAKGAVFVDELDQVPGDATVVFSAHGVSPAVRDEASRRGLAVIDTTCPLVARVHAEARRFAGRGDTVILIGHAGHDEVKGIVGEAPESIHVVADKADISALEVPDPARVSYLTQTTLAEDEIADLVDELRSRFPQLRGPASRDVCYAATNRQRAVTAVVAAADLVLVIGSASSSNSTRLAELARRCGPPAHLIDSAADIRADWLVGVRTIGLTAGASAPPGLVAAVVEAIAGLGGAHVIERESAREIIQFAPPPTVRFQRPAGRIHAA